LHEFSKFDPETKEVYVYFSRNLETFRRFMNANLVRILMPSGTITERRMPGNEAKITSKDYFQMHLFIGRLYDNLRQELTEIRMDTWV